MKKFVKEKEMEIILDKNIAKMERKVYLEFSKGAIKSSMGKIKKLNNENKKFDKFNAKLKSDLKVVRSKLKLINSQLKILSKKEKFLLGEIESFDKNKKNNRLEMLTEKKEVTRLRNAIKSA